MGKGGARKGLSLEEKQKRMLAYMQEHQTVFSLKELEKLLPKATGIISQSIKDVLKMLCDDDLVEFDKIGSGNFYWALPSKAVAKKRARVSQLEAKLQRLSQDEKALEKRKEVAEKDRQPTEERKAKLRKVRNLKETEASIDAQLTVYKENNPLLAKELKESVQICKEAANRWFDNLDCTRKFFMTKNSSMTEALFYKWLHLPADLDYVE